MTTTKPEGESIDYPAARARSLDVWLKSLRLPSLTDIEVDVTLVHTVRLRSPGNAVVRGLLGERLRRRTCLTGARTCDGCTQRVGCDYDQLFARHAGSASPAGLGELHGFWIQGIPAEVVLPIGARITARLVTAGLVDQAAQSLHLAFRDALSVLGSPLDAKQSLSPRLSASRAVRREVTVADVESDAWLIEACTPLLLSPPHNQTHIPPCPQAPWLRLLLAAGLRRLKALAISFGDSPSVSEVLLPALDDVRVLSGALIPWNGRVLSRRQGRQYPIEDAFSGAVLVRGSALREIGPLLQMLERTNVGKKTGMGFGHLSAQPVTRP